MAQKLFDVRKYQDELPTLIDGTDSLANQRELVISFYHVPSGRSVFFKAFIESFSETYSPNFTPNEVFGRTDPIYQYKNTTRKISLTFKVPAASEGEAYENLGRVSALEQMLYPSYTEVGSATTLSQAPLVRLKVMNLLQKNVATDKIDDIIAAGDRGSEKEFFVQYQSTSDSGQGLLGVIDNLSVDHNITGDDGVFHKGTNTILPKNIQLSVGFSPIHETTLGWDKNKEQMDSLFPYGVKTNENILVGSPANALPAYKAQVQKERDEELKRKQRQQTVDSARARYTGFFGTMRFNADSRRLQRGNERAEQRIDNLIEAGDIIREEEGEEAFDQFVSEVMG
jgi:hypothetical protein